MLKKQLAHYGVKTPRFDFAAINYLRKTGADLVRLNALFPKTELSIAADVVGALMGIPILSAGAAAVKLLDKQLGEIYGKRKLRQKITNEIAERVLAAPAEPDLAAALPHYFALDANDSLDDKVKRLVLFFDTHEAFWGEGNTAAPDSLSAARVSRDEWLRSLLGNLDLGGGIVVVVAGRVVPIWDFVPTLAIPKEFIYLRHVGPLTPMDAETYLLRAGLNDVELRRSVAKYATFDDKHIHPYFLGLCADAVNLAQARQPRAIYTDAKGWPELSGKDRELAARFLLWVGPDIERAIISVSACRTFNLQIFQYLGKNLGFDVARDNYERLLRYSFISPVSASSDGSQNSDTVRVHHLLRSVLSRLKPEAFTNANRALFQYYAERSSRNDFSSVVEQIYHENTIYAEAGLDSWTRSMSECLKIGRYDRARLLLSVLEELTVPEGLQRSRSLYLSGQTYLGLGRYIEAESVLDQIPHTSAHAALLRAELAFCRSEFAAAEEAALEAIDYATANEEQDVTMLAVFRVAEIQLYRGQFETARRTCLDGELIAEVGGNVSWLCRWLNLTGELSYFSGDISSASQYFDRAQRMLESVPESERDRVIWASVYQNVGLIHESRHEWDPAYQSHQASLEIRRSTGDARGIIQSLHGMGKSRLGAADFAVTASHLIEAERFAADMGEQLSLGKIWHSLASLRWAEGGRSDAEGLLARAQEIFEKAETPFDIAHVLLSRARLEKEAGSSSGIELQEHARRLIEEGGFHVLYANYPTQRPPSWQRIRSGILCYAAGDALGAPVEGSSPVSKVDWRQLVTMRRSNWPQGATSDDTHQMLIVGHLLSELKRAPTKQEFLAALSREFDGMRGVGPTTSAAVASYRAGKSASPQSATNGAVMRSLPIGWATPVTDQGQRRNWAARLTKSTHDSEVAVACATIVAEMTSWAIEGVPVSQVVEAGVKEAHYFGSLDASLKADLKQVVDASAGCWHVPSGGVTLDSVMTVAAVVHILATSAADVTAAVEKAISLGGDTDTTAAIVGGILGSRSEDAAESIPWLQTLNFPDGYDLEIIARQLSAIRRGR